MHTKQAKLQGQKLLTELNQRLGKRWQEFLRIVKIEIKRSLEMESNADGISVESIFLYKLLQKQYALELNKDDKEILNKAYSAKSEMFDTQKINMKPFFDFEESEKLKKTYGTFKYRLDEF